MLKCSPTQVNFHSSIPALCGLIQRIVPWILQKKSQNEMSNETLFADIYSILCPLSQIWNLLWQRFATFLCFWWKKKKCWGSRNCWWRTETPPFMKTKDKEIPRTWALIKSKHHPPSQTQRIQGNFPLGTEVPREWLPWCQPSFEVDHYKDQGCGNIEHEVYIKWGIFAWTEWN